MVIKTSQQSAPCSFRSECTQVPAPCTHLPHDIVAVSHAAYQKLLAQEVYWSLFQCRAHCFTKEGHLMCAQALLAYGASTSFQYKV